VVTRQRLAQLSTDVEVTRNQIASTEAQRAVLTQQQSEGTIVAPADGRVLTVPASRGAVIMPGEPVATIGSGGFFCGWRCPSASPVNCRPARKSVLPRAAQETAGRLAKIYPQIDNGRVIADVEVDKLDTAFVNARILVDVPIGTRHGAAGAAGRPSSTATGSISSASKAMTETCGRAHGHSRRRAGPAT
jgi:hypothetical protein